jgi:hypothetical protein
MRHQQAENRRNEGGQKNCAGHASPKADLVAGAQYGHCIGGDAEEGGVTERRQAGVAHQDIETHGQDPEYQDQGQDAQPIGRNDRRRRQQ